MGCPGLHCGGCGGKGGALGGIVLLGVVAAVVRYLWSTADAALEGARASTAQANLVVGWLVGGGFAFLLVAGGIASVVYGRRRAVEAPVEQKWTAEVDRALNTQRAGQLGQTAPPAIAVPPRRLVCASAQRLDRSAAIAPPWRAEHRQGSGEGS